MLYESPGLTDTAPSNIPPLPEFRIEKLAVDEIAGPIPVDFSVTDEGTEIRAPFGAGVAVAVPVGA